MKNKTASEYSEDSKDRRVYTDFASLFSKYEKLGESIIYLRDGFYPAIQMNVVLKEKSREQLGDIEKTILGLIGTGLAGIGSLSTSMGISANRLEPLLKELGGRSLIQIEENTLSLRELGKLSLEYGAEVIEVPRSFLLCGLTGDLLPRGIYDAERVPVSSLPKQARYGEMLDPALRISLAALDFKEDLNRHDYNIPHEALSVTSISSHEPLFLRGKLIISICDNGIHHARLVSGASELRIKNADTITGLLEPLGFSMRDTTPEKALKQIIDGLEKEGLVRVGKAVINQYGNPELTIHHTQPSFESTKINGLPILSLLGTKDRKGKPIARFPFSKNNWPELLRGRTMTLIAGDHITEQRTSKLRLAIDSIDNYYRLPKVSRPASFKHYLSSVLTGIDGNIDDILTLANEVNYTKIIRLLASGKED